jgi:hypothetical protein
MGTGRLIEGALSDLAQDWLGSNGISPEISKRLSSRIFASAASSVALSGHTCHENTIFSPSFASTARRKSVYLPLGTLSSQDSTISMHPYSLKIAAPFSAHLR